MTLLEWSQLSSIAGMVLTFVTAAGTIIVLMKSLKLNKRAIEHSGQAIELNRATVHLSKQAIELAHLSKRSDVLVHCNERFGRIMEMRASTDVQGNPMVFYERFWALQEDQFTHWKGGFVDADVFDRWMKGRYRQFQENILFGGMSHREGYERAVATWDSEIFKSFMHMVHIHGSQAGLQWAKQNGLEPPRIFQSSTSVQTV